MNYADVKYYDVVNGPGIRHTLFVSGCIHKCNGCFNEKLWDFNYGKEFTEKVGADFLLQVYRDKGKIDGITLLGGEPFEHAKVLSNVAAYANLMKYDVWCYTGYTLEELVEHGTKEQKELLEWVDVLVDGRFVKELAFPNLRFRGSSNQRIIDMNYYRKTGVIAEVAMD